jgi:di/tricarboxylate transporter
MTWPYGRSPRTMLKSSYVSRFMFGLVAVVTAAALFMHTLNWQKQASVDWPAFFNMLGLFVLGVTGALDPASARLRLILSAVALGLIFPSALLLLRR